MPEPALDNAVTSGGLADRLVTEVQERLTQFVASTAPGLELPRVFAGHPVLDDTTADLMYVLGLLVQCGVDEVAGLDIRAQLPRLIAGLDPSKVEGFYSYRVGETVLRIGGLDALPAHLREPVLAAVETPNILAMLDDGDNIPPNFAVVAARVLGTQARLQGLDTGAELDTYIERVRGLFSGQPNGWVNDGMGAWVHYDIYTPDMYLFAEPLADRLGAVWTDGLTKVLSDLDDIVHPGGTIVWGRSIGALGMAMTIELAAVACGRDLGKQQGRWLQRADETLTELTAWFPNGVIAAHQHRAPMFYRGTARRLQMTLDIYGKLLLAALELRRRPDVESGLMDVPWSEVDRLVDFDADTNAALWSYRSPSLTFALPTMMGFSAEYTPSPRSPGLFEQPTSGHPTMLPVVSRLGHDERTGTSQGPLVPAGLPTAIAHTPGELTVTHQGWAPVGQPASHEDAIGGGRVATYRVEGRSLVVHEQLTFDDPDALPGPLSISIAQRAERPLDVDVEGGDSRLLRVDTSGVAEWRSFWGELPVVHQAEPVPARSVNLTWRVTPHLRVASTIHSHAYDTALYGPITDRVVASSAGMPDASLRRRLRDIDVLHMAWPEWWSGTGPDRTRDVLAVIRATGTRILWTQHNLLPHFFKNDDAAASYQLWAEAADAVIHHTEVGKAVALDTYRYGQHTTHHVIGHGHWGDRYAGMRATTRENVELEEAWAPCAIRLAVVGTPRREKDLQLVINAVHASARNDIQLVIRADLGVDVPEDSRIVAEYGHVEEQRFHRRLAAYDALVLPFEPAGMLTTGTAFDCIGAGVPAITSDWDFFDETFAGADLRYGSTAAELTALIDSLTAAELAHARLATEALQSSYDWSGISEQTLDVLENIAARPHGS